MQDLECLNIKFYLQDLCSDNAYLPKLGVGLLI